MKKILFTIFLIIVVWGCIRGIRQKTDWLNFSDKEIPKENQVGMANPASTNCIEKWGTLEIKENKKWQYGVCLFQDNRQCEERALMRGDCPVGGMKITGYETDGEVYCAISGGELSGVGTPTPMCKRVDGTRCNAQANFDGDCPSPYDLNPDAGNGPDL